METSKKTKKVICQPWTEYERGMGSRPDGYSLHLTNEDRVAFVNGYNSTFNNLENAPDEYSKAVGGMYTVQVDVEIYQELVILSKEKQNYPFQSHGKFFHGNLPEKSVLGFLIH